MDDKICKLPSDEYYSNFEKANKTISTKSVCDSHEKLYSGENQLSIENLLSKYQGLKDICYKLEASLHYLKEKKDSSKDMKKHCTYLQLWLEDKVISTVESKSTITYIILLYTVWRKIMEKIEIHNKNECETTYSPINIDYYKKWKKIHDYNYNHKTVKCALQNQEDCSTNCNENCKENCKEYYCKYNLDIFNIYEEFEKVCTRSNEQICPVYWKEFKTNYEGISDIEKQCKKEYEKLGFYKVKKYFGEQGIEEYIEQYESEYIFSFFEKLIGYSIKYYLSKTIHYSKYILLPILSFFGSKIAPKADDMRKMWRNVQGVTNPASLLNPMKPPGGGNKIGLPFLPK
ncbi:PIR Superfamily Protein [Plasmodium ovale curtisi]|uniref:PIR Superfamily Protein n=1 Tax=Plasmodium ovale curtisi TaxID=864141 RepID=A0A1A8WFW9_PLAOA|nr:PIR Superfamily Protein [Plasmodium ovale curtisi]